jgi:hypothetical protein
MERLPASDVDAEQSCSGLTCHRAGNGCARVAALDNVVRVVHQLRPRARGAIGTEPVPFGLPEKPKPGIEAMTLWTASSARPPWRGGS